jgi:hypothetical protein
MRIFVCKIAVFVLCLFGLHPSVWLLSDIGRVLSESNGVISKEGLKILGDKKRRERLNKAVDHYKKHGNWDLMKEV